MKSLFVTGTDTDVGKTWVSCLLLRQLRKKGIAAGAYKPVCSGVTRGAGGGRTWSDVEQLAAAIDWSGDRDRICPQRFDAAVAPNVAAERQGETVCEEALHSGINKWRESATHVVVEGAGGLLCPLSDASSVADLAMALDCPLLIVAANRLGVINHTLLTVETAIRRGLKPVGVVLNEVSEPTKPTDDSRETNLQQLSRLLPQLPMYHCEYGAETLSVCNTTSTVCPLDLFT